MSITLVYRGGVFVPLEPVDIPDETMVKAEVLASPQEDRIPPPDSFLARHALRLFGQMSPDFNDPLPDFDEYTK